MLNRYTQYMYTSECMEADKISECLHIVWYFPLFIRLNSSFEQTSRRKNKVNQAIFLTQKCYQILDASGSKSGFHVFRGSALQNAARNLFGCSF